MRVQAIEMPAGPPPIKRAFCLAGLAPAVSLKPLGTRLSARRAKLQRIERDREDGGGENQAHALLRQKPERDAKASQDEGELADLGKRRGDREPGVQRIAEEQHEKEGAR